MEDDFEALRRRMEFDQQRFPLEEQARQARESGDLAQAAAFWSKSLELARRAGEDTSRWYVEGQLADVLVESGQIVEAKKLLETSLAAGNDIPFAHSLLVNIYMNEGAFHDAFRVQHDSWRSVSERAQRNGMPPLDPSAQIVGLAKWWKDTGSEEPIALAEKWAEEAQARNAWFAARHERAQFLEKKDAADAALELYLELVRQGTRHDATYTRAMILLDRAKRTEKALTLAQTILGLGLSASLEEQARKRIVRLETKVANSGAPRAQRTPKTPKALVPAFSVRSGESSLKWVGQVEVKGGISSIVATPMGVFATGGTEPGLWWIANGTAEPMRLRSIAKRTRLYSGRGSALVTDDGTVSQGSARVEILGADWTTTASLDLPGVTSEVALASWGLAIGCRAGGLYSVGWNGAVRWRFDVPEGAEASAFGRACPYFVSSGPEIGTVVFSSYTDVYALTEQRTVAWKWRLPAPHAQNIGAYVSIQMPAASVSAVQATRDGGAWIASQHGDLFRLSGQGKQIWSGSAGGNTSQLVIDHDDRLVAVAHSDGIALVNASGGLTSVLTSKRWPRVVRSSDGRTYLASEGKVLQVLDATGQIRAVVEFSRSIAEAAFVGPQIVVAAGKLVTLAVEP